MIDAYARYIVGWRVSRTADASFVPDALEQALHDRRPVHRGGLVHHSGRILHRQQLIRRAGQSSGRHIFSLAMIEHPPQGGGLLGIRDPTTPIRCRPASWRHDLHLTQRSRMTPVPEINTTKPTIVPDFTIYFVGRKWQKTDHFQQILPRLISAQSLFFRPCIRDFRKVPGSIYASTSQPTSKHFTGVRSLYAGTAVFAKHWALSEGQELEVIGAEDADRIVSLPAETWLVIVARHRPNRDSRKRPHRSGNACVTFLGTGTGASFVTIPSGATAFRLGTRFMEIACSTAPMNFRAVSDIPSRKVSALAEQLVAVSEHEPSAATFREVLWYRLRERLADCSETSGCARTTAGAGSSADRLAGNAGSNHVRMPELERRTSLSRSTIYRRIKAGRFPKQIPTRDGAAVWWESDIAGWLADPR